VVFGTDGAPDFGAVVVRLPDGARTIARVPRDDSATLEVLMASSRTAVGQTGRLTPGHDGLQQWTI
jgi:hypothetical protein